MKALRPLLAVLTVVVLVGAGCNTTTTTNGTSTTTSSDFTVGADVAVGDITHKVTSVEVLDVIPTESTIEEWELLAEELPADDGFQWVHIEGEVTNDSGEEQIMDSTSVNVQDGDGNEFDASTDTYIYVEDDLSPTFLEVAATQTKPWEAYFMVPTTAEDLVLYVNDLSFLPEDEALIDLGL